MLKTMRKHAASFIIKVLFVIIILAFIWWGGMGYRERGKNTVAKVAGTIIPAKNFLNRYREEIQALQKRYKSQLDEKMLKSLNIGQRVLDELIEEVLLVKAAQKYNITVTDKELEDFILNYPLFQEKGKFSQQKYLRVLHILRMNEEEFEASQREQLLIAKVKNFIKENFSLVSQEEITQFFNLGREKINLEFVEIDPKNFLKDLNVTSEEKREYFENNKEEFAIPPKVKLEYLVFKPKEYIGKVDISDKEIKEYYQLHSEEFQRPLKVRLRQILLKLKPETTQKEKEKIEKKAEGLQKAAASTKDFATLAKKISEGKEAEKGGLLGDLFVKDLKEPIKKAVISLKEGEVSPVIETDEGFHIIKLEKILEGTPIPLEGVRKKIIDRLKKEKANEIAARRADDAQYEIARDGNMEGFAKKHNLKLYITKFFSKDEKIKGIDNDELIKEKAFALKKGEVSDMIELNDGYYIIKIKEYKPSRIPKFYEVEEKVAQKTKEKKAKDMAKKKAEEILSIIKKGKSLSEVAKKEGLTIKESGPFYRFSPFVPKIGFLEDAAQQFINVTKKSPVVPNVLSTGGKYYVAYAKEFISPTQKEWQKEKDKVIRFIQLAKAEEIYNKWLDDTKKNAKIELNEDFLKPYLSR